MKILSVYEEETCLANLNGIMYAKKGSMVAYKGDVKFDKVLLDPNGGSVLSQAINHGMKKLTGENLEIMKCKGQGMIYFSDLAQHVTIVDLMPGESILVESENLLAFTDNCKYGVKFLAPQVGGISQKGLFTTKITAESNDAQVAVLSNGNPIIVETPCHVDPDALVAWTGPDPQFKAHVGLKTLIGQTSGESYTLEFTQPGNHAIVQPFERESGFKLAIDDDRYTPQMQGSAMGNTMDNMRGLRNDFQNGFGSQANQINPMNSNGANDIKKMADVVKNLLG